jgi:uncharacterized protein YegP (UPF0339 family)
MKSTQLRDRIGAVLGWYRESGRALQRAVRFSRPWRLRHRPRPLCTAARLGFPALAAAALLIHGCKEVGAPPDDADLKAAEQIAKTLNYGSVVFDAPDTMHVDEESSVQVVVGKQPIEELRKRLQQERSVSIERLPISNSMQAKLEGPNFEILEIGSDIKAVQSDLPAEWWWAVKAKKSGIHVLYLTVSCLVETNRATLPLAAPVLTRRIEVKVVSLAESRAKLHRGTLVFNVPESGDVEGDVQMLLAPTKTHDELRSYFRSPGRIVTVDVVYTGEVEAELKSYALDVTALSPPRQLVGDTEVTEWLWHYRAREAGSTYLRLEFAAIKENGQRIPALLTSGYLEVPVSTWKYTRAATWSWIIANLYTLLAALGTLFLAALTPVARRFWRRRSKATSDNSPAMRSTARFELLDTQDDGFGFELKDENGNGVLLGQRYKTKASAQDGVESVRANASLDERYRRHEVQGVWTFSLTAVNGRTIGTSEGYASKSDREQAIERVKRLARNAPLADLSK